MNTKSTKEAWIVLININRGNSKAKKVNLQENFEVSLQWFNENKQVY